MKGGVEMANDFVRESAKAAGVHLWEIADALGITDGNFSRKLRHEFTAADREKVLEIIKTIKAGRRG